MLSPGTYTIRQSHVNGWSLIGLSCVGGTHAAAVDLAHRKITLHVVANDAITCTYTDTHRVADGLISAHHSGPYKGNNIYAAAPRAAQTVGQVVATGETKNFWVKLQNDGLDTDSFRATAIVSGSQEYRVAIFRKGVDVTAQVEAGTFTLSNLGAGHVVTLRIQVTAHGTIPVTATRDISIVMRSKSAPRAAVDIVTAHVRAQ